MDSETQKLLRSHHMFENVLELPFKSDAEIVVKEYSDYFHFIFATDDFGDGVSAQPIEICPGVTKIVIRESNVVEVPSNELGRDFWRFRLPPSARPELASAVYVNGELIVTVPKGDDDGAEEVAVPLHYSCPCNCSIL
ncbi:uncharacterized protein LOC143888032 [Tasmannia lanceolata]|uniref:uncharacterized protein LOC143888032 n=1 Tax=Tasmannia lanceolata TaxID=3420 RepID=UPI004062B160